MDPDEFVARMVAAGVPDMELSAAPGDQLDAATLSLIDHDETLPQQAGPVVAGSPRTSMAQAQPLVDPSSGHLVARHSAPPGAYLAAMPGSV